MTDRLWLLWRDKAVVVLLQVAGCAHTHTDSCQGLD